MALIDYQAIVAKKEEADRAAQLVERKLWSTPDGGALVENWVAAENARLTLKIQMVVAFQNLSPDEKKQAIDWFAARFKTNRQKPVTKGETLETRQTDTMVGKGSRGNDNQNTPESAAQGGRHPNTLGVDLAGTPISTEQTRGQSNGQGSAAPESVQPAQS